MHTRSKAHPYVLLFTHKRTLILQLSCRTDSDYRITLQRQLEYAFKLCVVSIGFCSSRGEEPHKAFRHQRHRTTEIANCKNTNCGSEGCRRVSAHKNHANKQHSVFSAPLECSFLLIWPCACFTPGWLNVPLGLEVSAEG